MMNYVLWKRLTETDFNAMNAEASPHGSGGGARHIALGVRTNTFPIDDFIGAPGLLQGSIDAVSPKGTSASLDFYSNPDRRGGEWTIRNQYSHRHPAWLQAEGFPAQYSSQNPPYVLVFRAGEQYYARFRNEYDLDAIWQDLPDNMLSDSRGIAPCSPRLLAAMDVPIQTLLSEFELQQRDEPADEFDPEDIEDGRKAIFTSIIRRQGQSGFRNTLLRAYDGQCAITRVSTVWVLEAAHITPYKGGNTNSPQNGLLLRADIHTLFDMGLVAVQPQDRTIRISSLLRASDYWSLNGSPLLKTKEPSDLPSTAALAQHFTQFRE